MSCRASLSLACAAAVAGGLVLALCRSPFRVTEVLTWPLVDAVRGVTAGEAQGPRKTCTAGDYTTGSWVYDAHATVAPGYSFCQLDRRQDCRVGDAPGAERVTKYAWRPSAQRCALRSFNRDDFLRCVAGKRVVFMGDSISRNQQQSLQCMLLDAPEPTRPWGTGWKVEYDSEYPAFADASVSLVMSLLITPEEIAAVAPAADVLVVGTGPHWFPRTFTWVEATKHLVNDTFVWDAFPGGPAAVGAFFDEQVRLRVAALLRHAKPDATVVWRVPDVAHNFAARAVDGPESAKQALCGNAEPGEAGLSNIVTWPAPFAYLRDAVLRHAAGTRIHVLDLLALSGSRPDAHPGGHYQKEVFGQPVQDCLHWCLPGAPDTWNQLLAALVCDPRSRPG